MQISEHIERLVNLLKGDEPSDHIALDEDVDLDAVGRGPGEGIVEQEPALESDDEDNKIEEV